MSPGPAAPGAIDDADDVREEERFDPERLRPFLAAAFPGAAGPIGVRQFRRGHSNLTYLVSVGGHEAVLRRAPFGVPGKGAHDMAREYAVLSALRDVYPRAPRPISFCEDASVLGARFYLMERVRGVVLRSPDPPPGVTFTPELLRATSTALVDNLADLHAVDWRAAGLGALSKGEGYVARQVNGWTERWVRARTDEIRPLEEAAAWIAAHMPADAGAALVHNDYKYDNVVLDPSDLGRVVAVLDWEMATIGDPLMDLGTTLGYWIDPDDAPELRARAYGPSFREGNLGRLAIVERYAARTGRDPGAAILFHYVFALFKIAVIVQQIYKRWVDGLTRDPRFATLGEWVRAVAAQAGRALERGRVDRLGA